MYQSPTLTEKKKKPTKIQNAIKLEVIKIQIKISTHLVIYFPELRAK